MKALKFTLLMIALVVASGQINAQNFGYINSAALLEEMPKIQEANSNLETLQKQLDAKGQKMIEQYRLEYEQLNARYERGEIAPKDLPVEQEKMQKKQQDILNFEQDIKKQMQEKQEAIYKPILDAVKESINEVAKSEGYTYIFDTSPGIGVIVYMDESADVTDQVKAKLIEKGYQF
jgi:outer membrane protein